MKRNNYLNTVLNDINKYSRLLKESYVFDENEEYNDEYNEYDDEYESDEMVQKSNIDDKVNQIRTLALDGIQEFAKDVDSKEYDFFKKIWLMCDKVSSEKENNKNNEI